MGTAPVPKVACIVSPDEHRIVNALRKWADNLDARADRNPFSFDRVRANILRKVAVAIEEGRHR